MDKLKHFLQQSWLLIVASFVFGLLIAVTNAALSPIIEQQKINKLNALAGAMLPEAENFVPLKQLIEIRPAGARQQTVQVYRAEDSEKHIVGWSFNARGSGFGGTIELVIVVGPRFEKMAGYDVLVSSETPGYGDQIQNEPFRQQFAGAPVGELTLSTTGDRSKIDAEIVSITGATISSEAVVNIVSQAVTGVKEALQKKGMIGDGAE